MQSKVPNLQSRFSLLLQINVYFTPLLYSEFNFLTRNLALKSGRLHGRCVYDRVIRSTAGRSALKRTPCIRHVRHVSM